MRAEDLKSDSNRLEPTVGISLTAVARRKWASRYVEGNAIVGASLTVVTKRKSVEKPV